MKAVLKKTVGVLLGITMMTSNIMAQDYEDLKISTKDKVEVQNIILTKEKVESLVRKELNIGSNYRLDSADVRTDDDYLKKIWKLYFNTEEGCSISVEVDAETGELERYRYWEKSEDSLIQLTEFEALTIAVKYLEEKFPDKYKRCKRVTYDDVLYEHMSYEKRTDYSFLFVENKSDELLYANSIILSVSGITKKVNAFDIKWNDYTYNEKPDSISLKTAKDYFYKQNALQLKYIRKIDEEQKEESIQVIPVYEYTNEGSPYLNAHTKDFIDYDDIYFYELYGSDYPMEQACKDTCGNEGAMEIIPEKGVLSREKAQEIVFDKLKFMTDISELKIDKSNYNSYYKGIEGQFWYITFKDQEQNIFIKATINAKTGEVFNISYNNKLYRSDIGKYLSLMKEDMITEEEYDEKMSTENNTFHSTDINVEHLIDQTTVLISKMYPEIKQEEYQLKVEDQNSKGVTILLTSNRILNGIPFEDNSIEVHYDSVLKGISDLSITWFHKLDISEPSNVLTRSQVNGIFYDTVGLNKYLVVLKDKEREENEDLIVPKKEAVLAYTLNPYQFSYIDAGSGKLLDASGHEYEEHKEYVRSFNDIKGHKLERVIPIMNKMGYLEELNNSFTPNLAIAKKDVIKWIVLSLRYSRHIPYSSKNQDVVDVKYTDVNEDGEYFKYIKEAIEMGMIENKKTMFKPESKVTQLELVQWMIHAMGHKDLAQYTKIYNSIASVDKENIGYVALADYYNLGDTDKMNATMTRGDVVNKLYELLKTLDESI